MDIKQFNLTPEIKNYLDSKKISNFFDVQVKIIPKLRRNKNVIVESPTGSGKTLSFLIPIIEKLDLNDDGLEAIIFTPTRELATQIFNVIKEINEFIKFKSSLIIGGKEIEKQKEDLNKKKPKIIVATPERFDKLMKETKINLDNIRTIVVDEADMMVDFGFLEIIDSFKNKLTKNKINFAIFSASIPEHIQNWIRKSLIKNETEILKIKNEKKIDVNVIKTYSGEKYKKLKQLIQSDSFNPYFAIIFVKTNNEVESLYKKLKEEVNLKNLQYFSSNLTQRQRNKLLKSIHNNEVVYLITTDLISRGMDFEFVSHIVNYELPVDLEYYRHRIGRTNRGNFDSIGLIYDLQTPEEKDKYLKLQKRNNFLNFNMIKI